MNPSNSNSSGLTSTASSFAATEHQSVSSSAALNTPVGTHSTFNQDKVKKKRKRKRGYRQKVPWRYFLSGLLGTWVLIGIVTYAAAPATLGLSLQYVLLFTSLLSLIGSLAIVLMSFRIKVIQSEFSDLIVSMALTDFFFSIKFILSSSMVISGDISIITDGTPACYLSAIMGQFFGLGTISWNFVISLYLFLLMYKPIKFRHKLKEIGRTKLNIYVHSFVWGLSIFTIFISGVTGNIGSSPHGTCWLKDLYILFFYGFLVVYWCFSIFVVSYTGMVLKKAAKATRGKGPRAAKVAQQQLGVFTIAFVTVWLWGLIFRVVQLNHLDDLTEIPTWLTLSQGFFLGMGGFINFTIWLLPTLRRYRKDQSRQGSTRTTPRQSLNQSSKKRSVKGTKSYTAVNIPKGSTPKSLNSQRPKSLNDRNKKARLGEVEMTESPRVSSNA